MRPIANDTCSRSGRSAKLSFTCSRSQRSAKLPFTLHSNHAAAIAAPAKLDLEPQ